MADYRAVPIIIVNAILGPVITDGVFTFTKSVDSVGAGCLVMKRRIVMYFRLYLRMKGAFPITIIKKCKDFLFPLRQIVLIKS